MDLNDILYQIDANYAHPSNDIGHLVARVRAGELRCRKQLADLVCARPAKVSPALILEISRWGINDDLSETPVIRAQSMTGAEYKAHREKLGLTQAELAAYLGVTRETINRRESGGNITGEAALALRALPPAKRKRS